MAGKRFKLIGKPLTTTELASFAGGARFSKADTAEWVKEQPHEMIQDEAFHHLDRLSMLMVTSVEVMCPVGPHEDAGLNAAVLRACNISKVASVAVECSQGHWAEYPCG
jgi:hypothetical protein